MDLDVSELLLCRDRPLGFEWGDPLQMVHAPPPFHLQPISCVVQLAGEIVAHHVERPTHLVAAQTVDVSTVETEMYRINKAST